MTADAVQVELRAIKQRAESRKIAAGLPMLASELERIREQRREHLKLFQMPDSPPDFKDTRWLASDEVARITEGSGIVEGSPEWNDIADQVMMAKSSVADASPVTPHTAHVPTGVTVSRASQVLYAEMQRPDAGVRPQALDGHRLRVAAFVKHCGDLPLSSVTRAIASDWL